MKIWIRIGGEQVGPRPPQRRAPADAKVPFLSPGRLGGTCRSQALLTERFYQSACTTTRFWPKSRSYRKQVIKPFLPRPHPATCDFCTIFSQLRKATIQRSAVFASTNL